MRETEPRNSIPVQLQPRCFRKCLKETERGQKQRATEMQFLVGMVKWVSLNFDIVALEVVILCTAHDSEPELRHNEQNPKSKMN